MTVDKDVVPLTPFQRFVLIRVFDLFLVIALFAFVYMFRKLVAGGSGYHLYNLLNLAVAAGVVCVTIYIRPQRDVIRRLSAKIWQSIERWL
jgi:predicted Co/Zn/Cd cation transporter (cation efflux family)